MKPARDALGRLLPGNTANPSGRPATPWRTELRKQFGAAILQKVIDLALGKEVVYADGRRETPTPELQHDASKTALAYLVGKPVSETEIVSAEQAHAELRALDERELKRMVAETITDAEIVPVAGSLPATVEAKPPIIRRACDKLPQK